MSVELRSIRVSVGRPDEDGDSRICAALELQNASDNAIEDLEARILVRDMSGELLGVVSESASAALAPGASIAVAIDEMIPLGKRKSASAQCELEYRAVERQRIDAKLSR